MLRSVLGVLLTVVGVVLVCGGVFLAFDGKYGWRQFVSSFPTRMGSPGALYTVGLAGALLCVGGARLLIVRKA